MLEEKLRGFGNYGLYSRSKKRFWNSLCVFIYLTLISILSYKLPNEKGRGPYRVNSQIPNKSWWKGHSSQSTKQEPEADVTGRRSVQPDSKAKAVHYERQLDSGREAEHVLLFSVWPNSVRYQHISGAAPEEKDRQRHFNWALRKFHKTLTWSRQGQTPEEGKRNRDTV